MLRVGQGDRPSDLRVARLAERYRPVGLDAGEAPQL